ATTGFSRECPAIAFVPAPTSNDAASMAATMQLNLVRIDSSFRRPGDLGRQGMKGFAVGGWAEGSPGAAVFRGPCLGGPWLSVPASRRVWLFRLMVTPD